MLCWVSIWTMVHQMKTFVSDKSYWVSKKLCLLVYILLLLAIGDETTRGIEELVSKQRNHRHKTKSKSGSAGLFSSCSLHPQHSFVLPRRGHAPPALPAQLRSQLRQLLKHGPIGLSELERCYAVRFGRPLYVTHYGFYSIVEMLAAASDMITVRQTRMGSQLILKPEITPVKQMFSSTAALPKQPAGISSVSTNSGELIKLSVSGQDIVVFCHIPILFKVKAVSYS